MTRAVAFAAGLALFVGGFLTACGTSATKRAQKAHSQSYLVSSGVTRLGTGVLQGSGLTATVLQTGALPYTFAGTGSAPNSSGSEPTGLSKSGRILWQFEALLHDTFGDRSVSAHYVPGAVINFACANKVGCAPLAYWSPYVFTFTQAHHSAFHVSKKRFPPSYFGNYPVAVWIRGRFTACDRTEKRFLIAYSDAVGLSLDCL